MAKLHQFQIEARPLNLIHSIQVTMYMHFTKKRIVLPLKKFRKQKGPHFWMPLYEANCYILFGTLSKSKSWIWYQFNEKSSLKHSWNRYLLFSSGKSRVFLLKHVYDCIGRFHAKLTLFWLLIKDHMLRKKTSPIGYSFLRDIFIVLNSPARFLKKKPFRTFGSLLKFSSH